MPSQVIIYSQPRSACHLLERMLEGQKDATPFFRPFEQAWHKQQVEWLRLDSYREGMPGSMRSVFEKEVKEEVVEWKEKLIKSEGEGKIMMVHTHSFFPASPDFMLEYVKEPAFDHASGSNFTLVPDELLLHSGTVPVITIRNPRLVVPSAYRAMRAVINGGGRANLLVITCHVWARLLFDFYSANGIEPLVIDADDYMTSEPFVHELCKRAGLSPEEAVFSWSTATEEEQGKLAKPFAAVQTTLMGSTGANPGRAAKNLDLAAEEAQWEKEFGTDTCNEIQELVDLATPHFDYLYEKRLKL